MSKHQGRVGIIDELRGLSIILMIAYHAGYDLVSIFDVTIPFFNSTLLRFLQPLFAGIFILISGVACQYSSNNLKRGIQCFAIALGMSLVVYLVLPSEMIAFGILHMLGISMLAYGLFRKTLMKLTPAAGLTIFGLLFVFTYGLPKGYLGIFELSLIKLPQGLYQTQYLFPIGLPSAGFHSSDYFPLIPWLFLFLAGSYLGVWIKDDKMPGFLYKTHIRSLAFVGRYTLWIYILHQPVIYGVLSLIFYFIKG